MNQNPPHYRRVRKFVRADAPFSDENQQLTANQKMRRKKIHSDFKAQIEELYAA